MVSAARAIGHLVGVSARVRYLLLFFAAAVGPVAAAGQIRPAPLAVAIALFVAHALLSFLTRRRARASLRDATSALLLLGCLTVSGIVLSVSLALWAWPPLTPDGHRVMPIGQVFIGTIVGGLLGLALAVFGALRDDRRDRRLERLVLHAVGAFLIAAALIERR